MVKSVKILDKINLQKYIYMISIFLSGEISASVFLECFLQIRREDKYWMISSFDEKINRIMDSIFLDLDEYNPEEFYDPNDQFNINEDELKTRLGVKVSILNELIK